MEDVWYQAHDFAMENFGPIGCAEALVIFRQIDWEAELVQEAAKLQTREDCCPAGMGFRVDEGTFLHLMPTKKGTQILLEWEVPSNFLGLFKIKKNRQSFVEGFPDEKVPGLLEDFYAGRMDTVRRSLGPGR